MRENILQRAILAKYGAHPRVRIARINTGVGWFANGQPARKSDPGAYPVRFNPKGTADIVGIVAPSGRLLCIEVKSGIGKQTTEQAQMQATITRMGGAYCVVRTIEEADQFMATLGIYR